ncbi:MAG: PAS domain-containing protein [Spirochaetales bacterium]|nr:PAS domain-containing protein [Spirochaetales bacterium]
MQRNKFLEMDKIKFELSTRVLKPILIYFEKKYNRQELMDFVRSTSMNLSYLEDEKNWIAYDYYNLFLEELVEYTGNPNATYEAGAYALSKEAYGYLYSLLIILKFFGSPGLTYKRIFELGSSFSNVGRFNVISMKKNKIIVELKFFPGYSQTKLNCLAVKGQLANVPVFWNLPRAKIKETQCAAHGAESCIYEFSWMPRPFKNVLFAIFSTCFMIFEVIFYFFQPSPVLDLKTIIISGLSIAVVYFLNRVYQSRKILKENEKLHTERSLELEMALTTFKKEYEKLHEANQQITDKANKLSIINMIAVEITKATEEDILLQKFLDIIMGSMDFDRGIVLFLNSEYRIYKPTLVKLKSSFDLSGPVIVDDLPECRSFFSGILEPDHPFLLTHHMYILGDKPVERIIIPIRVQGILNYLVSFDNHITAKPLKEANIDFFHTVSRQMAIALDNIFTSQAAHTILANIPSSIVIFDRKSLKISFVNKSYIKSFYINPEDVLGNNILDVIMAKEHYRDKFANQINEVMVTNFLDNQELQTSDNRTVGYTLFKMPKEFGREEDIGIVMKDITEQKEMQDQLVRAEKMAALGTLVSGIAHEVNNPLYGVLGTAEIIHDEAKEEEIRNFASDIIDFTTQAADIVKDLSSYARSMKEEKETEIDINEAIEAALRIVSYSPKFIDIKIKKDMGPIPKIVALGGEIRQIYMNLVNNAVHAMGGRGALTIRSRKNENFIETEVEDTGSGISEEIISKIFDPFFTTKTTGEGTGLGLNIVYRLVTKYSGLISVESQEGRGTRFIIKFPVS